MSSNVFQQQQQQRSPAFSHAFADPISQNICITRLILRWATPELVNLWCFVFVFLFFLYLFPADLSDGSMSHLDRNVRHQRSTRRISFCFVFFAGSTRKWSTSRFWPRMGAFTSRRAGSSKRCWWDIFTLAATLTVNTLAWFCIPTEQCVQVETLAVQYL